RAGCSHPDGDFGLGADIPGRRRVREARRAGIARSGEKHLRSARVGRMTATPGRIARKRLRARPGRGAHGFPITCDRRHVDLLTSSVQASTVKYYLAAGRL